MREIKFRVWDIQLQYLFMLDDKDYFINNDGLYERKKVPYSGDEYVRVSNNFIVEQYTCLHDGTKFEELSDTEKRSWLNLHTKEEWKGKEIYEGDILRHRYYSLPVVVTFEYGRFQSEDVSITDESLRVIGNIHKNPELLEVNHEQK